jgi:hypothetical protein
MSDDKKAADVEDHFGFLCDVGHSPRLGGSRLGIPIRTESPVPGLIAFLKHKQMLIVLDSCEHVIGAVAQLMEQVLNAAPGVHILATSRSFPKLPQTRRHCARHGARCESRRYPRRARSR